MGRRPGRLILGFVVAATTGVSCGTISNSLSDAGMDSSPLLPRSCKQLLDDNPRLDNGTFTLGTSAGAAYQAYCDMEHASGGWTLVLKVDGGAATSKFGYDNTLWTNTMTLQEDKADTSRIEAKFPSFSEVAISEIRVVMVETESAEMTLKVTGTSFMSVMRGPFIPIAKTRQEWLNLVANAVVQPNCNKGGINNFFRDPFFRVRIGMVANEQADCNSPDSFVGIGGGGGVGNGCNAHGTPFVPPSAGAVSGGICNPTSGPNHPAFAYVYVR